MSEGRRVLTEYESKQVLKESIVDCTKVELAGNGAEAVDAARRIGFPVVLKISSPDITHKADLGGIELNLRYEDEVKAAYESIVRRVLEASPQARVMGVTVQEMLPKGLEVIIGVHEDPSFEHVLMFGLGGIFTEVLKDISFSPLPITEEDALQVIGEVRSAPIIFGYRGKPAYDVSSLQRLLVKISNLTSTLSQYLSEMDLNPVFVFHKGRGCKVADARIVLKEGLVK
jgi:succinyl-CoA synthetase beta subunit